MVQQAKDKDRALAQSSINGHTLGFSADVDESALEDGAMQPLEAQGSKCVVIHVGSQNLRIGLGSDALPKTFPMCIARKVQDGEATDADEEPAPKRIKIDGEIPDEPEKWFGEEFAKEFNTMSQELKNRMRQNKRRVMPNSRELVHNFNRRTKYEEINEHNDPNRIEWTELPSNPKQAPEYFTGEEALRIPENSKPPYRLYWPIRHGWFNEKDYENKNLIYNDFTTILLEAIKSQTGVSRKKEMAQFSCVFIIPDLYERRYVVTILDILMRDIGFGRVCFHQESLAATFGAGYSNGCIVDIGHQKTSICCVDEGLCIEDSRMNLKYGGADVTETFMKMTLSNYYPYYEININLRHDYLLAEEHKQKFCTMQESEITVQNWDFFLRVAGQDTRKYHFRTYDEPMLAPMVSINLQLILNLRKRYCYLKLY
jgi:actin-related protein 8